MQRHIVRSCNVTGWVISVIQPFEGLTFVDILALQALEDFVLKYSLIVSCYPPAVHF